MPRLAGATAAGATAAGASMAAGASTPLRGVFTGLLRSTEHRRSACPVHLFNRGLGAVSIGVTALHPGRLRRASRSVALAVCPVPSAPGWERVETSTIPLAWGIGTRPSAALVESIAGTLVATLIWPAAKAGCTATGMATTRATLPGTTTTTAAGVATGLMDMAATASDMAGMAGVSAVLGSASDWVLAWEPSVMALVVLVMGWVVLGTAATAAGAIPAMVMDLRDQGSAWEEAAGD